MFKCGVRGIRTHDTCYCIHAFQACVFNHSAITPKKGRRRDSNSLPSVPQTDTLTY